MGKIGQSFIQIQKTISGETGKYTEEQIWNTETLAFIFVGSANNSLIKGYTPMKKDTKLSSKSVYYY